MIQSRSSSGQPDPRQEPTPKVSWGWGFEDRAPFQGQVCAVFALPSLQGSVRAGGVLLNGRMPVLRLRTCRTQDLRGITKNLVLQFLSPYWGLSSFTVFLRNAKRKKA